MEALELVKEKPKQRRVKRGQRKKLILEKATELFSEKGFSTSTRDIAAELGVTQALLYKYFKSKEELIDAVFERRYQELSELDILPELRKRKGKLEDRLLAFYTDYFENWAVISYKLHMQGVLAGYRNNVVKSAHLFNEVITELMGQIRDEYDLPDFEERPLAASEFELLMKLHGAIYFSIMRRLMTHSGPNEDIHTNIENSIKLLMQVIPAELKAIHENWAQQKPLKEEMKRFEAMYNIVSF